MADETKNNPLGSCKGNSFDRRLLLLSRVVCYARDDTNTSSSYLGCQFNWQKGTGVNITGATASLNIWLFSCMCMFQEAAQGLILARNRAASAVKQFHKNLKSTHLLLKATIKPLPTAGSVPLPSTSAFLRRGSRWLSHTTENLMLTNSSMYRQRGTTSPLLCFSNSQGSRPKTYSAWAFWIQESAKLKWTKLFHFPPIPSRCWVFNTIYTSKYKGKKEEGTWP